MRVGGAGVNRELTEREDVDRPNSSSGGNTVRQNIDTFFGQHKVWVFIGGNTVTIDNEESQAPGVPVRSEVELLSKDG